MAEFDPPQEAVSPDEAFAILSDEVRMNVLQELGETGGTMSFSELREAIGVDDPGRFNYHLNQLVGHFIRRADEGYELRRPGRRIIEAVLAGAVTEAPDHERTEVSWPCLYCETEPVEIDFQKEQLGVYCTECEGSFGGTEGEDAVPAERQRLFYNHLPAAGVRGRSAEEQLLTSIHWSATEVRHLSVGVCPRCSASVECEYVACEAHDSGEGICPTCNRRPGVILDYACTNCIFEIQTPLSMAFSANMRFIDFLREHGYNPIAPVRSSVHRILLDCEERILSVDPLDVEVTFSVNGDELTFQVDESLDTLGDSDPYRRGLQR